MKNKLAKQDNKYNSLLQQISDIVSSARQEAYASLSQIMIRSYWEVGKKIIEFEQKGKSRADYGSGLLINLSKDLKQYNFKGFSKSNLYYMRLFYMKYSNFPDVSGKLTWSHYVELLGLSDDLSREFYENLSIKDKLSVRELKRQIKFALFERIALSKDKKEVLEIARSGNDINESSDVLKNPFVLEFLGIPEDYKYTEKELEQKIIDNLKSFLLELGKGFAFVDRQFRITLDNNHFYVDLVFYHTILKCYILIDLKINKASHLDVGQMNMYLNYFKAEEVGKKDNPPIGIILSAHKDDVAIKYALGGISNNLFVSKYQLYLPDKNELEDKVRNLLEI